MEDFVINYVEVGVINGELFGCFFKGMLEEGINLVFFKYEVWFIIFVYLEVDILEII